MQSICRRTGVLFLLGAAGQLAAAAGLARAQDKPAPGASPAIYEIALDLDNDGKLDRAVLVNASADAGYYAPDKSFFMIGAGGRADLYIYLGAGDAPLDLAKPPSFLKRGLVIGERFNQVYPLETKGKASLLVKSAYSLFGNWKDETLTIVHRNGQFVVAGLTYGFELKDGTQGDCDINFLTGKGEWSKGLGGAKKPAAGKFAPVKLADWSGEKYPAACR